MCRGPTLLYGTVTDYQTIPSPPHSRRACRPHGRARRLYRKYRPSADCRRVRSRYRLCLLDGHRLPPHGSRNNPHLRKYRRPRPGKKDSDYRLYHLHRGIPCLRIFRIPSHADYRPSGPGPRGCDDYRLCPDYLRQVHAVADSRPLVRCSYRGHLRRLCRRSCRRRILNALPLLALDFLHQYSNRHLCGSLLSPGHPQRDRKRGCTV